MENNILDSNSRGPVSPNYREPLPNSTATLVLGICSIVTCFCYGIIGMACGIVALVISRNSVILYKENPEAYSDWQTLQGGRICAIIGISLSALYILVILAYLAIIGTLIAPGLFNN